MRDICSIQQCLLYRDTRTCSLVFSSLQCMYTHVRAREWWLRGTVSHMRHDVYVKPCMDTREE